MQPRLPPDPDLEPGFPVQTYETAGSYHAGPAIHALIGNIDSGDPRSTFSCRPRQRPPLRVELGRRPARRLAGPNVGAAYAAVRELSPSFAVEIFAGHFGADTA